GHADVVLAALDLLLGGEAAVARGVGGGPLRPGTAARASADGLRLFFLDSGFDGRLDRFPVLGHQGDDQLVLLHGPPARDTFAAGHFGQVFLGSALILFFHATPLHGNRPPAALFGNVRVAGMNPDPSSPGSMRSRQPFSPNGGKNSLGREDYLNESLGTASSSVKANKKRQVIRLDDLPVLLSPEPQRVETQLRLGVKF